MGIKWPKNKSPLTDVRAYRQSMGENQTEFWGRFMVTQSGGSRYEMQLRSMPKPIAMLLVAFADGILSEDDLATMRKKIRQQMS